MWAQWASAPRPLRERWRLAFLQNEGASTGGTAVADREYTDWSSEQTLTSVRWFAFFQFLCQSADAQRWRTHCSIPATSAEAWLSAGKNRWIVAVFDSGYPPLLRQTADAPWVLYGWGRPEALRQRSISIVGSRHPTPSGKQIATQWAATLAQDELTIVSGLATGIDGAAHAGALRGGGYTVAVLGSGLHHLYPKRHAKLANQIAEQGAVVTECPPDTPPMKHQFPARNRIIAGLSEVTVVVEAAATSGTLITARLAVEGNRDVWAVPGPIYSPNHVGSHRLIQQGAGLASCIDDIRVAMRVAGCAQPTTPLREYCPIPGKPRELLGTQLSAEPSHLTRIPIVDLHDDKTTHRTMRLSAHSSEESNEALHVGRTMASCKQGNVPPTAQKLRIVHALSGGALPVSALLAATQLPAGELHEVLLEMELNGTIARGVNGHFELI